MAIYLQISRRSFANLAKKLARFGGLVANPIQIADAGDRPSGKSVQIADGCDRPFGKSVQLADGCDRSSGKSVQLADDGDRSSGKSVQLADDGDRSPGKRRQKVGGALGSPCPGQEWICVTSMYALWDG